MNVYEIVTERILEALAKGVVPWRKPWRTETPKNMISGRAYRGVNIFLLQSQPFESPYWLTFKQAASLGGSWTPQPRRRRRAISFSASSRRRTRSTRNTKRRERRGRDGHVGALFPRRHRKREPSSR